MLTSGAGIAASNNIYTKAYGGIDFLTIIKTEKDIKTHMYDRLTERPRNPPAGSGSYSSPYPPSGCVSENIRGDH